MSPGNILQQVEGKMLEFKEDFSPSAEAVLRTCIAFANCAGGDIYFGVSDKDRHVRGIDASRIFDLEERFANWVHTMVEPNMAFDFSVLNVGGKLLIRISVPLGGSKPYYLKNKGVEDGTFIRVGSTTRRATPEILADLYRQRRNIGFDSEILTSLAFKDLDPDQLKRYWQMRGKKNYPAKVDPNHWIKLGAARKINGSIKPTVEGGLFFCRKLPDELEHATVEITRFGGKTLEQILDTKKFAPPIFDQIEGTMKFLGVYVEKRLTRQDVKHEVKYAYPMVALREAVVNAVCHRDYAISGSNVKIAIFDDRIEITNPGALPGGLLISDLGSGISESRNRWIARILRETGYIEQLGTGIQRMRLACENARIPHPLFQELGLYFKVTFSRNFAAAGIDEDEWKILNHLEKCGKVKAREVAQLLGVHKNTANYKLNKLLIQGKIVRRGKGKLTSYELEGR